MTTTTIQLEEAIRYAELGYPVFPCVPGDKHPLCEHGLLDATTDLEQIERWWEVTPDANVAMRTDGLLVIDLDEGNTWHADDPDRLYDLAVAPLSLTPNSGRHYIFRQPTGRSFRNTAGRLAPHVDTRADGGYIVIPPSSLNGKEYRWARGMSLDQRREELPEPPLWLIEELDPAVDTTVPIVVDSNKIPAGQRNETLARLAGNMRRVGMSEAEIGAALEEANANRCVPPLDYQEVQRIAASVARYEPDEVAVALAENHWEQMYAETAEETLEHADPGPVPSHLLAVPGLIGEVIDYTLTTAPYAQPVLAFGGALALQAILAGRKVRDESDNRTNLYILGLANSGAGKDYPRKVNQHILMHAGMSDSIGDTFASGEGIEDRLFGNPCVLFQTDEIDGLMTKINQAKDARHEAIINVLLKMYSSANSFYPMRVKAGKEPCVIDQPCLCIFGTAIPKHYYQALSEKMLSNGFFARMLILEAQKRGRGQEAVVRPIPESILETARWWVDFRSGRQGNLDQLHPSPRVVTATPEAVEVLRQLRERSDDEYSHAEDRDDAMGMAIWARSHEKARRLALIYACSENHEAPVIGEHAAFWASEFVDNQTRRMLFMASGHVSENEFDARCKAIVATLRKWRDKHGDAWMPFWKINRKHRWSEKEHDEVRTTLLSQRILDFKQVSTGGRPGRHYRLLETS